MWCSSDLADTTERFYLCCQSLAADRRPCKYRAGYARESRRVTRTAAVMDFFQTSARNVLAAETAVPSTILRATQFFE
jgi:hypothetical protein